MNLVIEVEGPLHNAINSRVPLGATVFKHRLLKAMGKNLVTIPYWEWNRESNSQEKTDYLKTKIKPFL